MTDYYLIRMPRPKLTTDLTSAEFKQYYFLKEELKDFLRSEGLKVSGSKADLEKRIIHYLNTGKELNEKTLGIPVIAIGIPTVMDIGSYIGNGDKGMIVTPKDADILNQKLSEILSRSINIFLQDKIEKEIILSLV